MMMVSVALAATAVTAPVAAAQDASVAEREAMRAETPWYERFTTSSGLTQNLTGLGPSAERGPNGWSPSARWGVTVDLRESENQVQRNPARNETSVGAFYQFTPRVRVGGQLSVAPPSRSAAPSGVEQDEPAAGVRLESAFRF